MSRIDDIIHNDPDLRTEKQRDKYWKAKENKEKAKYDNNPKHQEKAKLAAEAFRRSNQKALKEHEDPYWDKK